MAAKCCGSAGGAFIVSFEISFCCGGAFDGRTTWKWNRGNRFGHSAAPGGAPDWLPLRPVRRPGLTVSLFFFIVLTRFFTGFFFPCFTGCFFFSRGPQILQVFFQDFLGFMEFTLILFGYTDVYRFWLGLTGFYWFWLGLTGFDRV